MGLLLLILMFISPVISALAVMLNSAEKKQSGRQQFTSGLMILLSIGMHLIGTRALIASYLNLSSSSTLITLLITTIVTLMLGVALALLIQETRRPPAS